MYLCMQNNVKFVRFNSPTYTETSYISNRYMFSSIFFCQRNTVLFSCIEINLRDKTYLSHEFTLKYSDWHRYKTLSHYRLIFQNKT